MIRFSNDFDRFLFENRYLLLFIATMLQVFLVSFFPDKQIALINGMTFTLFVLANINLIRNRRRIILIMLGLAIIGILLTWIPDQSKLGQQTYPYEKLIVMAFIGVIIFQIISRIIKSKKVNADVIFGAVTIYILFGMMAGEVNTLLYYLDPASFSGNVGQTDVSALRYFSFVTITTLGYGDITPVSQLARATAVFFSLIGQIYLAVIVAFIVGKYVSSSNIKHESNI